MDSHNEKLSEILKNKLQILLNEFKYELFIIYIRLIINSNNVLYTYLKIWIQIDI